MGNFNTVPSQGKFGDSVAVVNENFMLAQQKMEELQAQYDGLTQSDIIVGSLPASGVKNTIYRVPNTTYYSDYMWNGTQFVKMAEYDNAIDDEPTPNSNNLVKSGGVAASVVFDISAYHATDGTLATYADLAAALDSNNGGGVPQSLQNGGMSVKFVRTSDNKYMQYRLMADSWNTYVAMWERYNDVTTSNRPNSDLDIADEQGNVLVRIAEGHIKTKNFDSRNVGNLIENAEMDEVLGGEVAVYLTDSTGAAVLDDEGKPIEII